MARRVSIVAPALVLVLGPSPAFAQTPPSPARLQYDRPASLAACPDEAHFRDFVAARLKGVDPFAGNATAPWRVTLSSAGNRPISLPWSTSTTTTPASG